MFTFQPVTLGYLGVSITVPADKVFRLIGVIEQHYDPVKIMNCKFQSSANVAMFYAPILTWAGFKNVDPVELAMHYRKNPHEAARVAVECIELMNLLDPTPVVDEFMDASAPTEPGNGDGEKKPEDPTLLNSYSNY